MRDDPFSRAVDQIEDEIARGADSRQAQALVDSFAMTLRAVSPSTETAIAALAALARGIIPDDGRHPALWMTAFVRIAASFQVDRRPDGSPVYVDETLGMLQ